MAVKTFPESELILNPDGSVYHLNLLPSELAQTIILVGDPDRVPKVSKYFDKIDVKKQKRELITHTGVFQGTPISVVSTGMGTDNIDIVLNELDALANIDFRTRQAKDQPIQLKVVRIGTSGALQPEIPLDSILISNFGLGFDNLIHYYDYPINEVESALQTSLHAHFQPLQPYVAQGSSELINKFSPYVLQGMTATCSGFYAPQGRQLRGQPKFNDFISRLQNFTFNNQQITNFEMETSGIYGLGRIFQHQCLSVNTIVVNRAQLSFSKNPYQAIDRAIELSLELLTC